MAIYGGKAHIIGIANPDIIHALSKPYHSALRAWLMNTNAPNIVNAKDVTNKARCKKCKSVIYSITGHDYVTCKCGAISIDGGMNYGRRIGDPAS